MSYKNASRRAQHTLRRPVGKMLGSYDETLSKEQIKANLISKKIGLEKEALKYIKGSSARVEIGREISLIDLQIRDLNLKRKFLPGFHKIVCDVIKSEVTLVQWQIWQNKARSLEDVSNSTIESNDPNSKSWYAKVVDENEHVQYMQEFKNETLANSYCYGFKMAKHLCELQSELNNSHNHLKHYSIVCDQKMQSETLENPECVHVPITICNEEGDEIVTKCELCGFKLKPERKAK